MPFCNQCGVKLLPEPGLCDQCEDENDEAAERIDELIADGHTNHCVRRQVWGDGECECEKKGIVPGRISRMIIAADTDHQEIEELSMFGYTRGIVAIQSGKSNGRSIYDVLMDGRITITGTDASGKSFQRIAEVRDGEIWDTTLKEKGETVHRIAYGKFESIKRPDGREIVHFKKGTGKGRHGKSRRHESIFGFPGWCHSWYKNGRLVRQKFIYDNKKTAYDYNAYKQECIVKDPDGYVLYEIKGALKGVQNNAYHGCHSVFSEEMQYWFTPSTPFEVKKEGKITYAGQENNHQRVGKWVIHGKVFYYQNGLAIPKKLYETPPDKLDPAKILKIENAQIRMAMMEKIGPERIAEIGKTIHKDGDMRLYDIPKYNVRILRVRCTTTKAFYFLRVPKDATKCEEARQWTFHVGTDIAKPIKFAVET